MRTSFQLLVLGFLLAACATTAPDDQAKLVPVDDRAWPIGSISNTSITWQVDPTLNRMKGLSERGFLAPKATQIEELRSDVVRVVPGNDSVCEVDLARGGRMEVRIINESWQPMPGIKLEWEDRDPRRASTGRSQSQFGVTNAEGRASFSHSLPGIQTLRLVGDIPGQRSFVSGLISRTDVDPNLLSVHILIGTPLRIVGKVVNKEDQFETFGGGMISLVGTGPNPANVDGWLDANGSFVVFVPHEDTYSVSKLEVFQSPFSSQMLSSTTKVVGGKDLKPGQPPYTIEFTREKLELP